MTSHLRGVVAAVGLFLGLAPGVLGAQQPTVVTGRVTTDAGTALQGASITIPTMGLGAYSQADGRYTFTVPATRSIGQAVRSRRVASDSVRKP